MTQRLALHQMERITQAAGYTSYNDCLYQLYVVQRLGLPELALRLGDISQTRLRSHLAHFGIKIRGRGGRHESHTKVIVTPELVQEVSLDGVSIVAQRMEVDYSVLYQALKRAGVL